MRYTPRSAFGHSRVSRPDGDVVGDRKDAGGAGNRCCRLAISFPSTKAFSDECEYLTFQKSNIHNPRLQVAPSIYSNTDERTTGAHGRADYSLNSRRNEMKKIFTAIALGLFSVAAFADPYMDADVSPLGNSVDKSADEIHPEEQDC